MAEERYSDKRLTEGFTAYVLLSQPIGFELSEILDAVAEDYPVAATYTGAFGSNDYRFDETSPVNIVPLENTDKAGPGSMSMIGGPGPMDAGICDVAIRRAIDFPGAQQAVDQHRTYISISCKSSGTDLAARFLAARAVTCYAAVFAKLPIATAVYFPSGDTIRPPESWAKAADVACAEEWPFFDWISLEIRTFENRETKRNECTCGSVGMAAFNGTEIAFAAAPVHPGDAAKQVYGALYLQLAGGNTFKDSDTIGIEGTDQRLRIRFKEEDDTPGTTDTWVIIHPESSLDEFAMFGERNNQPPPPGVDNSIRPKKGFLSRLLRPGAPRPGHRDLDS